MAMPLAVKPKETESAPLPAYPVAPPSQTQTSARGMTPPRHYAGGAAYAGVPKGIPHYAGGTDTVNPWGPGFESFAAANPDLATKAVQHQAVLSGTAIPRQVQGLIPAEGGAPTPSMSTILLHPREAVTTALAGPAVPAPGVPVTVSRGDTNSAPVSVPKSSLPVMQSPGEYDVGLKGQPYASTPQEVATAAKNTGLNPIALQNAAGAMSEPGALQSAVGAIANPHAHTPQTFADATRNMSMHQFMQMVSMLRYDPAQQAWKQLHEQNNQRLKGMSDPNSPEAIALRQKDELEMAQKAGVGNIYVTKPVQQTDANGMPLDYDYTAGQPTQ